MDTINMNLMNAALIDLIHQVVEQELKDRETPTMDVSDYEYENSIRCTKRRFSMLRQMRTDALIGPSLSIDK